MSRLSMWMLAALLGVAGTAAGQQVEKDVGVVSEETASQLQAFSYREGPVSTLRFRGTAIALDAVMGNFMGPRSPNSVYTYRYRMAGKLDGQAAAVALPIGGVGAAIEAIASAARRAGADIRTGSPIARVLVKGERVAGLVLEDGSEITVSTVLSNADPKTSPVIFNSENHDTGADYNTGTGIFTVPETGLYSVSCHLEYGGTAASLSRLNIYLKRNTGDLAATFGGTNANDDYVPRMLTGTWLLDAGDTIRCNAFVNGSASQFAYTASFFTATRVR